MALEIRQLPTSDQKVLLAFDLANLSTEGDFGRDTLQEVTTTLAGSVSEKPQPDEHGHPNDVYSELAQLYRYEHMTVSVSSSSYEKALKELDELDAKRKTVDFSLNDITGQSWTLSALKGKVVLVNFWATWCPPCRKEMPDLDSLYSEFKGQGFVILAISDEDAGKVQKFIGAQGYRYPILLDPGRKVNDLYQVGGIPKSFLYDRKGRMVGETIDMRTKDQFYALLKLAGLKKAPTVP